MKLSDLRNVSVFRNDFTNEAYHASAVRIRSVDRLPLRSCRIGLDMEGTIRTVRSNGG
jgi:hypothetical protein